VALVATRVSLAALAALSAASPGHAEVETGSRHEASRPLNVGGAVGIEPSSERLDADAEPLKARGRIRALLAAAGMGEIEFVPLDDAARGDAVFAWAGHGIIGFVSVETRRERSADEVRDDHLRKLASKCTDRPESKGPRAREVAGYTLLQQTIGCQAAAGFRVIATTSILDTAHVLTFAHVGRAAEAERLEATNRALGKVLLASLRQGRRSTRPEAR
jgi:hypothetical protein